MLLKDVNFSTPIFFSIYKTTSQKPNNLSHKRRIRKYELSKLIHKNLKRIIINKDE